MQQVCDRVSIMAGGRCLVQGPVDEVLAAHQQAGVVLSVDPPDVAAAVLREAGYDVVDAGRGRLRVGGTGRPVDDPAQADPAARGP
ncbi:hypothetical protein GCM10025868_28000 [Angustibacter aerolatus]|uniref:Uncharacterized protein n=1 Tax=Angustibacter aerolatus TaxID=1162965 RepID=A0ABQ6JL88_9ACTN|nr:hypothetical protein GCM10025868_28000 [Angustibacter aerolatus]